MPLPPQLYLLDLLGTFAFAAFGAYQGLKKQFDLFGIFVAAFFTALGGATARAIILNNPIFYFADLNYLFIILFGTVFSILFYRHFNKINKYMLLIDAVGLATFAFIGATKAAEANLGFFAIVFLATLNAVGGGLLRDISIREIPQIFYRDFYASPAIILGIFYALFQPFMQNPVAAYVLLFAAFLLRVAAIHFHFQLWVPWKKQS